MIRSRTRWTSARSPLDSLWSEGTQGWKRLSKVVVLQLLQCSGMVSRRSSVCQRWADTLLLLVALVLSDSALRVSLLCST